MKILFHGRTALNFRAGFEPLLDRAHEIVNVDDDLLTDAARADHADAEVIIGTSLTADMPYPERLRLFHSPGAGYNNIDLSLLPPGATLCNCFGHEDAMAEYVMAALLARQIPLVAADACLREGDWRFGVAGPDALRGELGATTIGILGFGHIGKAIAVRAKAFGMGVTALSRRRVEVGTIVDRLFVAADLAAFLGSADAIVVAAPLNDETKGMIDAAALAAMRPHAVIINLARGPLIDERALYAALKERRIGGAIIDTWYVYPDSDHPKTLPSHFPFHELDNVVMTPHMSGWSREMIGRRQKTMAGNVNSLAGGLPLSNVVRAAVQ